MCTVDYIGQHLCACALSIYSVYYCQHLTPPPFFFFFFGIQQNVTRPDPRNIYSNWYGLSLVHVPSHCTGVARYSVCTTKGWDSLKHAEVNHACGSHVCTMGILYRRISTWRTEQLVNSSRHYVSTTLVRRLLNQEIVKVTIF